MRLTLALLKRKSPPGNIWIGKHRLAHNIYPSTVQRMVKSLKIEEKNMLLLRHPYLTLDQEKGHGQFLKKPEIWVGTKKLEWHASRMKRSITIEERFNHLMHGDSWDPTS